SLSVLLRRSGWTALVSLFDIRIHTQRTASECLSLPTLARCFSANSSLFRTYKSVSKQRTLTSFRMSTYEKTRGGLSGQRFFPTEFSRSALASHRSPAIPVSERVACAQPIRSGSALRKLKLIPVYVWLILRHFNKPDM